MNELHFAPLYLPTFHKYGPFKTLNYINCDIFENFESNTIVETFPTAKGRRFYFTTS